MLSPAVRHLLRYKKPTVSAAVNNTALDGAVNAAATEPLTLPGLTTTAAGKVIVFFEINGGSGVGITVSGATLGTFTARTSSPPGSNIYCYEANSSGALTSEVITITDTDALGSFCEGTAFGVKGVNTAANRGFDTNGALPNQVASGNGSISTSNANDFLIAGFRGGSDTAVTGWTKIHAGSFLSTSYLKVTTAQSGLSVPDPVSNNGGICDALVSS